MKILKNGKLSSVVYSCVLLIASSSVGAELSVAGPTQPSLTSAPTTPVLHQMPVQPAQAQPYAASVWGAMSKQFQFNNEESHPQVMAQIAVLQAHKKELFKQLQADAPYINYFFQQTQKHGVPAELALLPIIESDCNPDARSNVGAVGWWQLMPGTAAGLGLNCNSAGDPRKDIALSTDAALTYLDGLHKTFQDDWMLALAAYNDGPGNINKAIKHQKKWYAGIGFWDLHLPAETEAYVPKLLALAAVVRDPGRYGIELPATTDLHILAVKPNPQTYAAMPLQPLTVAHATNSHGSTHASYGYIRSNGVNSALMQELSTSMASSI